MKKKKLLVGEYHIQSVLKLYTFGTQVSNSVYVEFYFNVGIRKSKLTKAHTMTHTSSKVRDGETKKLIGQRQVHTIPRTSWKHHIGQTNEEYALEKSGDWVTWSVILLCYDERIHATSTTPGRTMN